MDASASVLEFLYAYVRTVSHVKQPLALELNPA